MATSVEEEEDICRVCRSEAAPNNPLFNPCLCTGSIKYIHQECLIRWLGHSKKKYCELCNYRFHFQPVYKENTPQSLSFTELISGVLEQGWASFTTGCRIVLVVLGWVFVMPYFTTRVWRLFFPTSQPWTLGEGYDKLYIFMDCIEGCALSIGILFIFLALMALHNFLSSTIDDEAEREQQMRRLRNFRQQNQHFREMHDQQLLEQERERLGLQEGEPLPNQPDDNDASFFDDDTEDDTDDDSSTEESTTEDENAYLDFLGDDPRMRELTQRGIAHGLFSAPAPVARVAKTTAQATTTTTTTTASSSMITPNTGTPHVASENENLVYSNVLDLLRLKEQEKINRQEEATRETKEGSSGSTSSTVAATSAFSFFGASSLSSSAPSFSTPESEDTNKKTGKENSNVSDPSSREYENFLKDLNKNNSNGNENNNNEDDRDSNYGNSNNNSTLNNNRIDIDIGSVNDSNKYNSGGCNNDDDSDEDDSDGRNCPDGRIGSKDEEKASTSFDIGDYNRNSPSKSEEADAIFKSIARATREERERSSERDPDDLSEDYEDFDEGEDGEDENESDNVINNDDDDEADPDEDENEEGGLNFGLPMFFDGPNEDGSLEELLGLSGPIGNLLENLFWVLLFNTVFIITFGFLPFVLGQLSSHCLVGIVNEVANMIIQNNVELYESLSLNGTFTLNTVTNSSKIFWESEWALVWTTLFGYCLLAFVAALYLSVSSFLEIASGPLGGMVQKTLTFFCTFIKVCVLMVSELGVFPLLCGWWLDICTLQAFDSTFSQRLAFFESAPVTASFLHWLVGMLYMSHFASFISVLREELRTGVLWFLRNPSDPGFEPVREMVNLPLHQHIRRITLSAIMYGSIVLALIYLPLRLCLVFDIFPMKSGSKEPLLDALVDLLLFHIMLPIVINSINPREIAVKCTRLWLKSVAYMLDLTAYLLGTQEDAANATTGNDATDETTENEEGAADDGAAAESDSASESSDEAAVKIYKPSMFGLRICVFLFLMWASLFSFNTLTLAVPMFLGRIILHYGFGRMSHDLYAFGIGWYFICGVCYLANVYVQKIVCPQFNDFMESSKKFVKIGGKCTLIFLAVGVVIPVLLGLIFELVIITPIRVGADETAVFDVLQSWALGCVLLKVCHGLVMVGPENRWQRVINTLQAEENNANAANANVNVDDYDRSLFGLNLNAVLFDLIIPLIRTLGLILSIPYIFACGVIPMFVESSYYRTFCFRYSYCLSIFFYGLHRGMKVCRVWFTRIHDSVRDDKYLVSQKLVNYKHHNHPSAHQVAK